MVQKSLIHFNTTFSNKGHNGPKVKCLRTCIRLQSEENWLDAEAAESCLIIFAMTPIALYAHNIMVLDKFGSDNGF